MDEKTMEQLERLDRISDKIQEIQRNNSSTVKKTTNDSILNFIYGAATGCLGAIAISGIFKGVKFVFSKFEDEKPMKKKSEKKRKKKVVVDEDYVDDDDTENDDE